MGRGLWMHAGLLVVASAASVYVWTRDTSATVAGSKEVTVWSGRPEDVQRVSYESKVRRVVLDGRKDDHGSWFAATVETLPFAPLDGGAPTPGKRSIFVSVGPAQKVAQALAPLKAVREVGRIDAPRNKDFGFEEGSGKLVVALGGQEHALTVGAGTPGGNDRYVRDDRTGDVYAVHGEAFRDLESGEPSLLEREFHELADADIQSVKITVGGKSREIVRSGPPGKRIWADHAAPDRADETVSNWISKVDRLRATEYVADVPSPHEAVARLDYAVKGSSGAFLELVKVSVASGKADYFARSERTRQWTKVLAAPAEQVEQDVGSVVK